MDINQRKTTGYNITLEQADPIGENWNNWGSVCPIEEVSHRREIKADTKEIISPHIHDDW